VLVAWTVARVGGVGPVQVGQQPEGGQHHRQHEQAEQVRARDSLQRSVALATGTDATSYFGL
jgi:hypothetical protein